MRRRRRARERQEKRKRENRRPILKKLCAALLRSFRGQHSEKMKGSARGNWDPREGQQPFRPNPNGAGDRTTTLRLNWCSMSLPFFFSYYLTLVLSFPLISNSLAGTVFSLLLFYQTTMGSRTLVSPGEQRG